jgi:hypothetical protein
MKLREREFGERKHVVPIATYITVGNFHRLTLLCSTRLMALAVEKQMRFNSLGCQSDDSRA